MWLLWLIEKRILVIKSLCVAKTPATVHYHFPLYCVTAASLRLKNYVKQIEVSGNISYSGNLCSEVKLFSELQLY